MFEPGICRRPAGGIAGFVRRWAGALLLALLTAAGGGGTARAAIQFDVFLGHDGVVPEASWFPVVCEIKNDGPTFTGVVEVQAGTFNGGPGRQLIVELPTGTLKRVMIPVFASARFQSSWDVRLLDAKGKVRAEQPGLRPRYQAAEGTVVLAALPRTVGGLPQIRQITDTNNIHRPVSARYQAALIPDNPLVFEGLTALYLNSEKALELKDNQVYALLAWVNDGGHLIVGVEQVSDVTATPWLRSVLPCDLTTMTTVKEHRELQTLVTSTLGIRGKSELTPLFAQLPSDEAFEQADLQVVGCQVRTGRVLAAAGGVPLVVAGNVGRGQVTTLLFSPEREPVRAWKNLSALWARVAGVPAPLYQVNNAPQHGGYSCDGIFGALIDSKQVRKLPVGWLLLLLVVYLVVIGPLDQYWLKRIKRPMLTWITFPCYVVLFSLLIYFIGYKLRAGESEWNELHVVDVVPGREGVELRGRTFASVYSPVNATYRVESQANFATFRSEFQASFNASQQDDKSEVMQKGDNFTASVAVPVWTSKLYVNDWWLSGDRPFTATVTRDSGGWQVSVNNPQGRPLQLVQVVVADRIFSLGEIAVGQTKQQHFGPNEGTNLRSFVQERFNTFQGAVAGRQQAFGAANSGQLNDAPNTCTAVSFLRTVTTAEGYEGQPGMPNQGFDFIPTPGLDLTPVVERGQAVVLAWSPDYSPAKPINLFTPRRLHRDTYWRLAVPVASAGTR